MSWGVAPSIKSVFFSFLGLLVKITRWRTWIKMTWWLKKTQRAWEKMLQPWFLNMQSVICRKATTDVTSLFWGFTALSLIPQVDRHLLKDDEDPQCGMESNLLWQGSLGWMLLRRNCWASGRCTAGRDLGLLRPCSNWASEQNDCPSIRKTP